MVSWILLLVILHLQFKTLLRSKLEKETRGSYAAALGGE